MRTEVEVRGSENKTGEGAREVRGWYEAERIDKNEKTSYTEEIGTCKLVSFSLIILISKKSLFASLTKKDALER